MSRRGTFPQSGTIVARLIGVGSDRLRMIIEAGYDIMALLQPVMNIDNGERRALWVMNLDEGLRFQGLHQACEVMAGPVQDYQSEIQRVLTSEVFETTYFVLAYRDLGEGSRHEGWLHEQERELISQCDFGERELLGQVVFDDEGWWMTIPRFSFRDYIGKEHLPRAAAFPGPHPFFACECPACVIHEERLAVNRARYGSRHQSINYSSMGE